MSDGYVIKRAGAADSYLLPVLWVGDDRPTFGPRAGAEVFENVEQAQTTLHLIRPFVGTARFDIICAHPDREEL